MQDVEVNTLAQGQAIRVRPLEVEQVVEMELAMLRLLDRREDGRA